MPFFTRSPFNSKPSYAPTQRNTSEWPREIITCFLFLIGIIFLNAWVSDDAFITFRSIENFWDGYGLTYNIAERVQAYTHPLWMLLVSLFYFFTRDFFYTSLLISVAFSAISVYLLLRNSTENNLSILILWLLSFSKGFVDFSSSGLENPLSHLLLVLFFHRFFELEKPGAREKKLLKLFFLSGLILLTRMDLVLLIAPALFFITFKYSMQKVFKPALLGFLPFFLWESFSLFYYGFPFPNTAYAKLNTGIGTIPLIKNGLQYLAVCFRVDPILVLTLPIVLGFILFKKGRSLLYASTGILLHTAYVIKIGGDFMVGRFLTASFFCALIFLLQMKPVLKPKILAVFLIGIFSVSAFSRYSPPFDVFTAAEKPFLIGQFADEKKFYYLSAGLLPNLLNLDTPHYMSKTFLEPPILISPEGNLQVALVKAAGYRPFEAGPHVHVVDLNALTDPLLSKLPVGDQTSWRIGHFERGIPDGYLESIQTQTNQIKNPSLARYYEKLCILTKGNLFSAERIKVIIKMNLKQYDSWLKEAQAYP